MKTHKRILLSFVDNKDILGRCAYQQEILIQFFFLVLNMLKEENCYQLTYVKLWLNLGIWWDFVCPVTMWGRGVCECAHNGFSIYSEFNMACITRWKIQAQCSFQVLLAYWIKNMRCVCCQWDNIFFSSDNGSRIFST